MTSASIRAAVLVALSAVSVQAQYLVPRQTWYAMTAAERANLQLVHDWWRDIMRGGNLDIASHYMPVDCFDMIRVDDGLIQEHWDVAFPNAIRR